MLASKNASRVLNLFEFFKYLMVALSMFVFSKWVRLFFPYSRNWQRCLSLMDYVFSQDVHNAFKHRTLWSGKKGALQ